MTGSSKNAAACRRKMVCRKIFIKDNLSKEQTKKDCGSSHADSAPRRGIRKGEAK